ncbi:unnamed protein product, partial [Ixodes pacificus]
GSGYLFDLEDIVHEFLMENGSESDKLVTYDITGDNKTRGLSKTVTMDMYVILHFHFKNDMQKPLSQTQVQSLQMSAVYAQIFHNNQSGVDSKAYISEQVEHEDEYMWTVTKGLEFTTKVKFSITVPLLYQFSSEVSTSVKTTSGSITVETRTTRQLIKQDLILPAGATIEAKWYVNEAQVVVPWESDIYLEGTVAALFETPNGDLSWRYFNVTQINHKDLIENGTSVVFRAKGLFKANVARSYHLSTSQEELTHRTERLPKYTF